MKTSNLYHRKIRKETKDPLIPTFHRPSYSQLVTTCASVLIPACRQPLHQYSVPPWYTDDSPGLLSLLTIILSYHKALIATLSRGKIFQQ